MIRLHKAFGLRAKRTCMGISTRARRFAFVPSIFLIHVTAGAQLQFPPVLETNVQMVEYETLVRQQIPEISTAPAHRLDSATFRGLVRREQDIVTRLKADPEYMAAAAARPPLQVLSARQVEVATREGVAMMPAWSAFLHNHGYRSGLDQETVLSELKGLLEARRGRTSASFFSGWAKVLNGMAKEILREPDLNQRWAELKREIRNNLRTAEWREFRADMFGVTRETWSLDDLDATVSELSDFEDRVTVLMQELNPRRASAGESWVLAEDLETWLGPNDLGERDSKMISAIQKRAEKRFADPYAVIREERIVHELILRELPPYLAIYRGVVGSDCSTSSSWVYPYSPYERDWWIENTEGHHIGYVSGNITLVDGRPTLYIRDVRMPNSHDMDEIELILSALYLARPYYGVDQMTIMNNEFTVENPNGNHRARLQRFGDGNTRVVSQVFQDVQWRDGVFRAETAGTYDNVGRHTNVRFLTLPDAMVADYRVHPIEGTGVNAIDPREDSETFWKLLAGSLSSGNSALLERSVSVQGVDWNQILHMLKNPLGLRVDEYYASVTRAFNDNGLPISKNLIKKNEALFFVGHMASPDAFEGEKNIHQSTRHILELIWRTNNRDLAKEMVARHLQILEDSELMARNVLSLFRRRQEADVSRIQLLLEAGYRFKNVRTGKEDWQWMAEVTRDPNLKFWLVSQLVPREGSRFHDEAIDVRTLELLASFLENEVVEDETPSIQAAELLGHYYGRVNISDFVADEVERSILEEDNLKIQVPLSLAYLRMRGERSSQAGLSSAVTALRSALENDDPEIIKPRWRSEAWRLLKARDLAQIDCAEDLEEPRGREWDRASRRPRD